jgi:hypothetical protein
MGDIEMEKNAKNSLPFIKYSGSDVDNIDENLDIKHDLNDEESEHFDEVKNLTGMLKSRLRADTHSEGGLPGSRKVSFHSDVGSQPNSRKVSHSADVGGHVPHVQHLHPVYSGIPLAPNFRKLSSQPFGYFYESPPSRKSSMEAFYLPHAMPRHSTQHGKISVISLGNQSDTGTIEGEEIEAVPQLNHYRISVFDNQRPTLYQLREDEQVILVIETFNLP